MDLIGADLACAGRLARTSAEARGGGAGPSKRGRWRRLDVGFGGAEFVGYKGSMTIVNRTEIARLPSGELTSRLYSLRVAERQLLVEFLAYLGELDARKVFLELGFKSTFAFCTDHLGLTRSSAHRRMIAARLMVRFPVVAEYLGDGRLGLTTLAPAPRGALRGEPGFGARGRADRGRSEGARRRVEPATGAGGSAAASAGTAGGHRVQCRAGTAGGHRVQCRAGTAGQRAGRSRWSGTALSHRRANRTRAGPRTRAISPDRADFRGTARLADDRWTGVRTRPRGREGRAQPPDSRPRAGGGPPSASGAPCGRSRGGGLAGTRRARRSLPKPRRPGGAGAEFPRP